MFDYMVFAQGEYTKQIGYLQPLTKPNAVRVDLEGGPTGDITENQGKNAIERLAQLAARNKHQDGGKQ
jgi:sRNA-binding protein